MDRERFLRFPDDLPRFPASTPPATVDIRSYLEAVRHRLAAAIVRYERQQQS
jgi:hypothetical protein